MTKDAAEQWRDAAEQNKRHSARKKCGGSTKKHSRKQKIDDSKEANPQHLGWPPNLGQTCLLPVSCVSDA